jgi:hypothetical protein
MAPEIGESAINLGVFLLLGEQNQVLLIDEA